ncbi:MAG TPA: trypsin-like peptidase domain-containing protein [Steroidobacteraceae bacterium]|nr:trypsin-like peptidase domain-containing protein [Steroidobacteraceae bacterium]
MIPHSRAIALLFLVAAAVTDASSQSATPAGHPEWARTLEQISRGVVAIQFDLARSFDTETNASLQATGFVVDAKRGLILTNRHVVTAGPVTAKGIFLDREEVRLYPVYRDPVHDFGFYRYDPMQLHFITPEEIALYPSGARVGTEIRVVGNDAGEQLSFLSGTLARLDRQAPVYGAGKYNDFNTFYYQAASNTSGGSSGSPVIDVRGRAVALNAGAATGAASSFYLPLDRVVRALHYIQRGEKVPRGTLHAVFGYTPFDELRELGLPPETEAKMRAEFPRQVGMLVVSQIQLGSAAQRALEVGDILLRVNGRPVVEFVALAALLDDAVGTEVTVQVQRRAQVLDHTLPVGDLNALSPDEYIEFGDAVVHNLSYQQARHMNLPVAGVYVANAGYVFGAAGIPRGAVIMHFAGKDIGNIDDLTDAVAGLADGDRATVRYLTVEDASAPQQRSVIIDRRWYPTQRCKRDDALGYWPCRRLASPQTPKPMTVASGRMERIIEDPRARPVAPSLVTVDFDVPYPVSGVTGRSFHGTGLIVDTARGLVVVDRTTVPVAEGDVRITFAGALEIPGQVVFVHPIHNLAVVAYDPQLIGPTPVQSARLVARELTPGEVVRVVGLRQDQHLVVAETSVAAIDAIQLPLPRTPIFRDTNTEVVTLVNGPDDHDGVIVDKTGGVLGLWSAFSVDDGREVTERNMGLPIDLVVEMMNVIRNGGTLRSLEAELSAVSMSTALKLGLSQRSLQRLQHHMPADGQVLSVARLVAGTPAAQLLQTGDLILGIDGQPVTRFREVERSAQKPRVRLDVWRAGAELVFELDTVVLNGRDIDRILRWAGATLQAPHRALAAQRGIAPQGVFVTYYLYGSPASRSGLWAPRRIVEVDGQPTPDLDAFLAAVAGKPDRTAVLLKTLTWNNAVEVITLKLDQHYWPTYDLRRTEAGWELSER